MQIGTHGVGRPEIAQFVAEPLFRFLQDVPDPVLRQHRRTILRAPLLLFLRLGFRLGLIGSLPTQFINAGSEKILQVTLIPPAGQTSEQVLERAIEAEGILLQQPDVELVQTSVPGEGDTGFQTIVAALQGVSANSATLTVRLDPDTKRLFSEQAEKCGLEPGVAARQILELYVQRLRAGSIVVNDTTDFWEPHPPFGGASRTRSGWGRIGGGWAGAGGAACRTQSTRSR